MAGEIGLLVYGKVGLSFLSNLIGVIKTKERRDQEKAIISGRDFHYN
jgi:hypothetical protein